MAGGEEPKSNKKLLLEHSRFSLYLHEGGGRVGESPLFLQVRVRPRLPLAADADVEPDTEEPPWRVRCAMDGQSYCLKRDGPDIFLDLGQEFSLATPAARSPHHAGCWYGCDDSLDEDEDCQPAGESLTQFQPPPRCLTDARQQDAIESSPRPFADPGLNASSCPSLGCDLQDDKADQRSATLVDGSVEVPLVTTCAGQPDLVPSSGIEKEDLVAEACERYLGGAAEGMDKTLQMPRSPASPTRSLRGPGSSTELVHLSSAKVEWRIWGIAAKLANYPKGSRVFSPEFDAFQASGLGLVFYPNGNTNAKAGFCSLGLKAPHGTHLRYKLYIGNTERFTDLRHNVTESWGFVDMCKVEEELQPDEDCLRLGAEIIDDIDANETLRCVSSLKVEWVINSMQEKLLHYRKDVAVYSDEFSAGGVDRLRMKFYPAGKKEADVGWCSLYLEAPKGSELRCRLSVGRKSMSFDRLEKFGEDSIWGFLTLCKLDDELVQDGETVRIGLEVLETRRLDARLNDSEDAYLKTLSIDKRTHLLKELDRIEKLRNSDGGVPTRFRILQLDLPDSAKAVALGKLDSMHGDVLSGESAKTKKWLDGLLGIPFGSLRKPLVSLDQGKPKVREYLHKAHAVLDEAVFGHVEPKKKIIQLLCQWIANPSSMSLVLGIQGVPGNGKTTLCRKGIAEALGRPFVQISLGGATDASVLEGHSYTYVGSNWGRIAGLIMEAQCMNPVIFFDELDKVSETSRGEEIIGVLTHLTDHSQNRTFTDRYFEGIPLDLSRALFIFSFNDETKINRVLKDRLTVINTEGFDQSAKLKIAREYLLPELLTNVGMKKGDVDIGREELAYLCHRCGVPTQDGGVRGIKQALESIILHLNEIRMTQDFDEDEGKADDLEKKADDGDKMKADSGHSSRSVAADKAGQTGCEEAELAEKRPAIKSPWRGQPKAKKPRVQLPVVLTKELIEQLVTQVDRKDVSAMMYS